MELPSDFKAAVVQARNLQAEGQLLEAERIYRSLAGPGAHRAIALEALADLFYQQQRFDEALHALKTLTREDRDNPHYSANLANLLDSIGRTDAAIAEHARLLRRQPKLAVAHFNLARLYGKVKQYPDAISSYEKSAELEIDKVEEVYSNMGALYSEMEQVDRAREMFERALEVSPDYIPAMYNLGGYYEEAGEKQRAIDLYERIQSIDPEHWDSLSRLAYPRKITSEHQILIDRLKKGVEDAKDDKVAQEALFFALGKAHDDLEAYDEAASAYIAANELGKQRAAPYYREQAEQAFDSLIELFDADWIKRMSAESEASPIFICGMFRSGSTLLERMLAAHPRVTAGGELNTVPWLVHRMLAPYPQGARNASAELLQQAADAYLSRVGEMFPAFENITDKRPENYLHLGLIKVLFPQARIIHTRRNIRDNCLSLYFQQFGRVFGYATDLEDAAHYYEQHLRLMAHWESCFGADICAVDYEELVESPEPVLRRLLESLGLEWDAGVLDFRESRGPVRTASIWQVRQSLYKGSVGRWRNYDSLFS